MCNLEVIGHLESVSDTRTEDAAPNLVRHVAAAIQGRYMRNGLSEITLNTFF